MTINDTRLLQLALEALEEKRRTIDEEVSEIQARLSTSSGGRGRAAKGATIPSAVQTKGGGRKRRRMSAAQRKLVSERMKKFWADRRKGKK